MWLACLPAPARTVTTNHVGAVIGLLTHTEQVRLLLNRIEVQGTLGRLCLHRASGTTASISIHLLGRWGGRSPAVGAAYMQRPATHSVVDVLIRMTASMSRQLDVDHSACLSGFDVGFGLGSCPTLARAILRDYVTSLNQLECLRHDLLESFGRITWEPLDADVMLLLMKEISEFLALTEEIGRMHWGGLHDS